MSEPYDASELPMGDVVRLLILVVLKEVTEAAGSITLHDTGSSWDEAVDASGLRAAIDKRITELTK